ncbi:hypothetical protein, partial [Sinorhizobium fredii]|uniref:hypothetical protein n=1 Tax=Rhizobium fredii TaxID=380 RepID=UPI001AEE2C7F
AERCSSIRCQVQCAIASWPSGIICIYAYVAVAFLPSVKVAMFDIQIALSYSKQKGNIATKSAIENP